ncbi:MAG: hypothetical protein R3B93_22565 [Bacteroidia bacterium]
MKNIIVLFTIIFSFSALKAQIINYGADHSNAASTVQLYGGLKYGVILGVGYLHKLEIKNHPIWIGAQIESPFGENILDDHKEVLSAQGTIYQKGSFRVNSSLALIHRATQNPYANMNNLGAEISLNTGIFRPKWFLAGEVSFDQPFSTYITHHEAYREIYPQVRDGWYKTSGGNMRAGIQGGYSLKQFDVNLQIGPSLNSAGRMNMLFFYGILGVNWRI